MKYENGKVIGVVKSISKAGKSYGFLHCSIPFDDDLVAKGFKGSRGEGFYLDENLSAKADYSMIGKDVVLSTISVKKGDNWQTILCDFNLK